MIALPASTAICLTAFLAAGIAVAGEPASAKVVAKAFADHCFNPRLTAQSAQSNLGPSGARIDFYDLQPFSGGPKSKPKSRAPTKNTDRRCEVAFDGYHFGIANRWVSIGLRNEGLINKKAYVPSWFIAQDGTTYIAAVRLNPSRIAVLQIGLRTGPNGNETFINVERLVHLEEPDR